MILTPRQQTILDAVERLISAAGYPPTVRELALDVRLSRTRVRQHLAALQARGAIAREPATARSIRIKEEGVRSQNPDLLTPNS
jgi:repressor LexA